jgi:hypothetical protein
MIRARKKRENEGGNVILTVFPMPFERAIVENIGSDL